MPRTKTHEACAVPGCPHPPLSRYKGEGPFCNTHYTKARRDGRSPLAVVAEAAVVSAAPPPASRSLAGVTCASKHCQREAFSRHNEVPYCYAHYARVSRGERAGRKVDVDAPIRTERVSLIPLSVTPRVLPEVAEDLMAEGLTKDEKLTQTVSRILNEWHEARAAEGKARAMPMSLGG
jgi:hypothetical protein